MKQKLSVSIEQEVIDLLEGMLESDKFRNKSHIVEVALNKLMEDEK